MALRPLSDPVSNNEQLWLNQAAERSFFCSSAWLQLLAQQGWSSESRCFWLSLAQSLWPLAQDHYSWFGLKLPRWRALANCYSSFYQPAGEVNLEQVVLLARQAQQHHQAVIELWPISAELAPILVEGFNKAGWHGNLYPLYGNWRQNLPAQFATYWQSRSSQLRHTVERRLKKLRKEQQFEFRLIQQADDFDWAFAEFERLYQKRWPGPELHPTLLPALGRHLLLNQQLRLGLLLIAGRPVAAQLWIVEQKRALMYKVAYDCDYQQYSPGSLLLHWMIEYLMQQDKIHQLDFLTGDDRYKADWLSDREQRYGIQAVRWNHPLGMLLAGRNCLMDWLRPLFPFATNNGLRHEKPHESTTSD